MGTEINEIIKDLVDILFKDEKSTPRKQLELLFSDAFKRGYIEGVKVQKERLLELIK